MKRINNAEIAKQIVKVKPLDATVVSRGRYGIYAPGVTGLHMLAETFTTRESAQKRLGRVIEHVTAILNAADVVRVGARSEKFSAKRT